MSIILLGLIFTTLITVFVEGHGSTAAMVFAGLVVSACSAPLVWMGVKAPPLTCDTCHATGWPADLDGEDPVCPRCRSRRFTLRGRHFAAPVLGEELVRPGYASTIGYGDAH